MPTVITILTRIVLERTTPGRRRRRWRARHTADADGHDDAIDPAVHERRWWTLGVLCMSLLIIVMDNTILNVAIPSLIVDLGATNSQIQWIVDSYVLVFAGSAAHDGQPVRPLWPQGSAATRHRPVRHRIGRGGHVDVG